MSKKFKASTMRQTILDTIIPLTMNEVYVHLVLQRGADVGEIPGYINDVVFTAISALELLMAPFLVWFGYKRRIRVAAWWTMLATVAPLPLLLFSNTSIKEEYADLCNVIQPVSEEATNSSVVKGRIIMAVILGLVTAFSRLVVWIHGIVFIDDYRPNETGFHLAIILAVRVIFLNFGEHAVKMTLDINKWLSYLMLAAPIVIPVVKLFLTAEIYDDDDHVPTKDNEKDFFATIYRTFSNKTAMIHTASLSLLVAGVWGFSLMNSDIMKTKYLVSVADNALSQFVHGLPLIIIIYMAAHTGSQYSAPKMNEYDFKSATKFATTRTVIIAVLVLILTFAISCDGGAIAGLSKDTYAKPNCSSHCRCSPTWNKFTPVCLVNTISTFYSPCHAGCKIKDTQNEITYLTECSCSTNKTDIIIEGSCNSRYCFNAYIVHSYLMAILHGFTVSSILMHFMMVIRSVDERDKAIALSFVFSITTLVAFIGGHLFFRKLSYMTCAFFQFERCEYHNSKFPITIGLSSFGLILISAIINVGSWFKYTNVLNKKYRVSSIVI